MANSKFEFEKTFLHILSHQLRTPAYSIRDAIDILFQSKGLPNNLKSILAIAKRKSYQLIQVLENLLDLADPNLGRKEIQDHKKVFISQLIKKIVGAHLNAARKKRLILKSKFMDGKHKFYIKRGRELLEQSMHNIVSNAIVYSNPKGKVLIKTRFVKPYLEIYVVDNGPGISYKDQQKLFTPFYRVKSLISKNTEGTGLGLAIAKILVTRLGGKISLISKVGKGTTFCIKLPTRKNTKKFNYLVGEKIDV